MFLCSFSYSRGVSLFLLGSVLFGLIPGLVQGGETTPGLLSNQNPIPYGLGSSWVVGDQLFKAGNTEEALSFLHMVYRAEPDVPQVALEFQEALQANGYFQDAVGVLDKLVSDHPDSLDFRFRRARLNAHLGKPQKALADLSFLHSQAGVTAEMISLEASVLSAAGEIQKALDVLNDGLVLFPNRGLAIYRGMVTVLEHNGQSKEIPAVLRKALKKYPDNPDLYLDLCQAWARLDHPVDALAVAEEADRKWGLPVVSQDNDQLDDSGPAEGSSGSPVNLPDSFRVELADYYAQHEQVERAIDLLADLFAKHELDENPSLWLARMLLGSGREAQGRSLVEELLNRWPHSGRGWFLAGKIAEIHEDWPEVISDLQKAVTYSPNDAEIRLGLVRAMMLAGENWTHADAPDSSTSDFSHQVQAAEHLVPHDDSNGQLILGYACRELGDLERGAWHFQVAAADSQLRLNALIQASLCFDDDGQTLPARNILETLRKENPRNPEIANSLGYFLAEKNIDLEESERLITEALEGDPSSGAYLDSMGWLKYRQGDLDLAMDFLIRAANALPEDPVILEHLGVVLKASGKIEESRDLFKRALALGGNSKRLQAFLNESGKQ